MCVPAGGGDFDTVSVHRWPPRGIDSGNRDTRASVARRLFSHHSLADGRAAFLHCVPNAWTRSLSNRQLEFAVRRLLRLKLRNAEGTICACGATLDGFGDHADSCPTLVGMRSSRHDRVNVEGIGAPAKQTGLSPTF